MARIAGIELQDNWKIDFALTKIKGIGWALSEKLMREAGIEGGRRVSTLTSDDVAKITAALENYETEGDLARKIKGNVKRLQSINSYRGMRHARGLPSRGQRTRSNGRTKKGKRKTVGAFKKEILAKMTAAK